MLVLLLIATCAAELLRSEESGAAVQEERLLPRLRDALSPRAGAFQVRPVPAGPRLPRAAALAQRAGDVVAAADGSPACERTYIMVKPDGVQRGLVGEIIKRFEQRGYKMCGLKLRQADEALLQTHYADLTSKPFFPKLQEYMLSGPVACMVWEGENVVKMGRQMLGETNPQASLPGTIRGDFSIVVGRNICHGSDSPENAEKEIGLWFGEGEVISWDDHSKDWVYE
jgi:nucleoside-diphosphate kinase